MEDSKTFGIPEAKGLMQRRRFLVKVGGQEKAHNQQ